MNANASVHNSCAPEVSPQSNRETVAIFLWPVNWPFVGCLLRQSLFRFRLLARTVALLLGCRCGLLSRIPPWEQPVLGLGLLMLLRLRLRLPGAVGQGAGRGLPLTVHDRQ